MGVGSEMVGVPRRRRGSPQDRLAAALSRVASDRSSSASALARRTLGALRQRIRRDGRTPNSVSAAELRRLAGQLGRTQPAMGPFRRWAFDLRRISAVRGTTSRGRRLLGWIGEEEQRLADEPARIARVAVTRLPARARLLTLSRSDTVLRALATARPARRPAEVVVLESLPGGEGRRMARDLRTAGVRARWVRDGSALRALAASDAVVIGADSVYGSGDVVHKVGTRALAAEAHRARVPVFVLAGSSKWVPRHRVPRRLPPEFDRTPAAWVREYWTDLGVVRPVPRRPPDEQRQREAPLRLRVRRR